MKSGKLRNLNVNPSTMAELDPDNVLVGTRSISSSTGGSADDILDRAGVQAEGGGAPTSHASNHTDGTDDVQLATNAQKGLLSSAHATDLAEAETKFFIYKHDMFFDSSLVPSDTAGEITMTNTNFEDVVYISVSNTDDRGNDITPLIQNDWIGDGVMIRLVSSDGTKYANFICTGIIDEKTNRIHFYVTFIDSNSDHATMSNGDVLVTFEGASTGLQPDVGYRCYGVSSSSVAIQAGQLTLFSDEGKKLRTNTYSSTHVISLSSSGANGLDTGTEANSTWYYIWAITTDTGSKVGVFSLSDTSPTMPTSAYKYKRLLGVVYNDSSGNIRTFQQLGNKVAFTPEYTIQDGSLTADAWTAVSTSGIYPMHNPEIVESLDVHVAGSAYAGISAVNSSGYGGAYITCDQSPVSTDFGMFPNSVDRHGSVSVLARNDGNTDIYYYVSNTAATIVATGYTLKLGLD